MSAVKRDDLDLHSTMFGRGYLNHSQDKIMKKNIKPKCINGKLCNSTVRHN